jgi:four helix bundle protein
MKRMSKKGKSVQEWEIREERPNYSSNVPTNKYEALELRCKMFAKSVRTFVKLLSLTIANTEDIKQLVRSSGSVGANYIEANDSLGKKDFLMHIKISRKEAKESRFWLRLLDCGSKKAIETERDKLITESTELMNIFGSIYRNCNE